MNQTWMNRLAWALRWSSALAAFLFVLGAALVAGVLHVLRPAPHEWAAPLAWGPWRGELSGPALLRIATHPAVLPRLGRRLWHTPLGPLQLHADADGRGGRAVCAPCALRLDALGREPVRLARVELSWERDVRMDLVGDFTLWASEAPAATAALPDVAPALRGRWRLRNQLQQVEISASVADQSIANAFGLFADRLPELARAQIAGRLNLELQWRWPSQTLSVKPRLDGFRVAGLGTEALLDALPSCQATPEAGNFGVWLPRAVLAAEDQRFFEHTGFDAVELGAAFSSASRPGGAKRGASTLSQQLAKLIYTGDDASHVRKLRELLYAVELDRTLGKARVLQLYLALAPWGGGDCGAAAAAQRYLGQPAHEIDPLDAAWLASLLHNPDAELERMARTGRANAPRVRWIVEHLRPLKRAQRRALLDVIDDWTPPPQAFEAAAALQGVRVAVLPRSEE